MSGPTIRRQRERFDGVCGFAGYTTPVTHVSIQANKGNMLLSIQANKGNMLSTKYIIVKSVTFMELLLTVSC